ncbi:Taurine-transporting ATPase [Syntrophobotulus glycolicus DSM 8271]|uniref:ABC-type quaternary amine transporter n=1 Tax=Syntrophobotulus glycolicus (strain DSM 8271 / FlGlyR) TaxID=645991 RepID=F0SW10_SYNGF|nr:ABC transporter ATP-binding protein [Syntrophobotulus glycolicus]ADY56794.1 Taurine-transporting ATPase [Syntrophobotulus glycolicus DSM 8271]
MDLIEIKDLSLNYQTDGGASFLALDQINLNVSQGEFICLLGPSGCGKSTLLYTLARQLKPSSGSIKFNGENLANVRDFARNVSIVFQEHALFPWLTVKENIEFPLTSRSLLKAQIHHTSDYYMKMVELEEWKDKKPRQLSGGMKQRVGIARALAMETNLILMDEPFGALDAQTRSMLQEELVSIWKKASKTIVFVTHDITEAIYLADRIVVMDANPGRIKAVLPVSSKRPRDTSSDEFRMLENQIKAMLKKDTNLVDKEEKI